MSLSRYFVAGGAGFIGSHTARRSLQRPEADVVVYDNFSPGGSWHLPDDPRLTIVRGDSKDLAASSSSDRRGRPRLPLRLQPRHRQGRHPARHRLLGGDLPDPEPAGGDAGRRRPAADLCFRQRRLRRHGRDGGRRDLQPAAADLDLRREQARLRGPDLAPTRTCSACTARASGSPTWSARGRRTASPTTSSAAPDPTRLEILGDGQQSKSYFHVDDVLDALLLLHDRGCDRLRRLQRRPPKTTSPSAQIADLVVGGARALRRRRIRSPAGDRGWKGDVPVVRFDTDQAPRTAAGRTGGPRSRPCRLDRLDDRRRRPGCSAPSGRERSHRSLTRSHRPAIRPAGTRAPRRSRS